jgi:haloalkane dehalogenase
MTPMATKRPDWLPEQLFPFVDRWLDVQGCNVHYVDEGSGPPLLLLHGNPTYSFLYRGIIRALQDRFRCIALDYPGFGLSSAPAGYDFRPASHARVVEAFVDALGLQGLMFMVQDWGGPIGLAVAGKRPDRVKALVIGNTWAWPDPSPSIARFSKFMGSALGQFLIRYGNVFVNVFVPGGVKRKKLSPEVMAAYRGPFQSVASRTPVVVFPREILASRSFLAEVELGLGGLRDRPALVLWADRDVAFREPERTRFEALFPRHRTRFLRGAGHYFQEDAPDEAAAAIREWWDEEVEPTGVGAHAPG